MRTPLWILLASTMALASCSGWSTSSVNPSNWFGGPREVPVETFAQTEGNPLIPPERRSILARPEPEDFSVPAETVTALRIEPTLAGAIIRAEGTASRQGAFAMELRPDDPALQPVDGVLAFTLRMVYPPDPTPPGTARQRQVEAAHNLSRKNLEGVRTIRVSGRTNAQESRRN
jgi:hypothetical protein